MIITVQEGRDRRSASIKTERLSIQNYRTTQDVKQEIRRIIGEYGNRGWRLNKIYTEGTFIMLQFNRVLV
jgi:hypothetical protein